MTTSLCPRHGAASSVNEAASSSLAVASGHGAGTSWKDASSYLGRVVHELRELSAWVGSAAYFSVPPAVQSAAHARQHQLSDRVFSSMTLGCYPL